MNNGKVGSHDCVYADHGASSVRREYRFSPFYPLIHHITEVTAAPGQPGEVLASLTYPGTGCKQEGKLEKVFK